MRRWLRIKTGQEAEGGKKRWEVIVFGRKDMSFGNLFSITKI